MRSQTLAALAACLLGCAQAPPNGDFDGYPVFTDKSTVCAAPLGDGTFALTAYGSVCASDHEGAEITCSLLGDPPEYQLTTTWRDGDDPNDLCAETPAAACGEVDATNDVTVSYGEHTLALTADQTETLCVPEGSEVPEY